LNRKSAVESKNSLINREREALETRQSIGFLRSSLEREETQPTLVCYHDILSLCYRCGALLPLIVDSLDLFSHSLVFFILAIFPSQAFDRSINHFARFLFPLFCVFPRIFAHTMDLLCGVIDRSCVTLRPFSCCFALVVTILINGLSCEIIRGKSMRIFVEFQGEFETREGKDEQ
jgi:hypothetical protein